MIFWKRLRLIGSVMVVVLAVVAVVGVLTHPKPHEPDPLPRGTTGLPDYQTNGTQGL